MGSAVISLIFIGNALGFITAALFVDWTRHRLGQAKTMALAQLIMTIGYIPMVCTAPFPYIVASFFLLGFGMGYNLAMGNVWCGQLSNSTTALGFMHGSYGIGGTIGPIIATTIVSKAGAVWSRYYFITLGLTVISGVVAWVCFRDAERERGAVQAPHSSPEIEARRHANVGLNGVWTNRVVILGAIFIFAYQGAEVSISGWVISFLLAEREGDKTSIGYVTAGFWAGITIGRFLLSAPAHRWGEKRFVCLAVLGATVFELIVWFIPNLVGNAVAVSIVGLLLGPVYPCAVSIFMRDVSKDEQVGGMGVISAFGSSGGALAPFTTGILAQAHGAFVLHPIAIGLFGVMMICWFSLPRKAKRTE
ncbi:major facilitator superfamily transporter [Cercophora scortea]|uniref:Major facilitator superfamily transporter n=1 Tax=Cercophora scortea TaxID=314031 RepID=A0AAE0IGZ4_9PEZI|nr:major facilitator superfamily transporter [Cercophora scortea]